MRLLIVDDEVFIRKGIVKLLEQFHKSVTGTEEAKNGEEALRLMAAFQPDIVITDIQMPVMNGLELAAAVRDRYPDVELIILTGYAEFEYVQQALRYQVADYLLKPVTKIGLEEVLMRIMLKDPAKWATQLENDSIRALKQTAAELVKHVFAENKTEAERILLEWKQYCADRRFSLIELKRVMGHLYLMFRSELMTNMKNAEHNEVLLLADKASTADDLFTDWNNYIEQQIHQVASGRVPRNKRIVDEAIALIEDNYGDPGLNLAVLAHKCGVNPPYLSKMFREVMKKPITQYISEYRLERARERLSSEDSAKITLVAEQCGFNDYPYFSKIFKKNFGVSPLEFKEKNS